MKAIYILILLVLVACAKSSKIEGKWTLVDIDYSEFEEKIPPANRESFKKEIQNQLNTIRNNTFFDFKKDQVLVLTTVDALGRKQDYNGTFRLSSNNDSLYLDLDVTESYKIISFTESELKLHTSESPIRTVILNKK